MVGASVNGGLERGCYSRVAGAGHETRILGTSRMTGAGVDDGRERG